MSDRFVCYYVDHTAKFLRMLVVNVCMRLVKVEIMKRNSFDKLSFRSAAKLSDLCGYTKSKRFS